MIIDKMSQPNTLDRARSYIDGFEGKPHIELNDEEFNGIGMCSFNVKSQNCCPDLDNISVLFDTGSQPFGAISSRLKFEVV